MVLNRNPIKNFPKLLKYSGEDVKQIFCGAQSDTVVAGNGEPYRISGGGAKGGVNDVGIILEAGVMRNLRVYVGQNGITEYEPCVVVGVQRQDSTATDLFVTYSAGETGAKENLQNEYIVAAGKRIYLNIYADEEGTTVSQVSWSVEYFPNQ